MQRSLARQSHAPLGAIQTLRKSFALYRERFNLFCAFGLTAAILGSIFVALETLLSSIFPPGLMHDFAERLLSFVSQIIGVFMTVASVLATANVYPSISFCLRETWSTIRNLWVPLLCIAALLWGISNGLYFFSPIAKALSPSPGQSMAFVAIGCVIAPLVLLLAIALLILRVRLAFLHQAIVLEREGVRAAFTRSMRLSKSNWWLLAKLFIIPTFLSAPLYALGWIVSAAILPGQPWLLYFGVGAAASNVLVVPISGISITLLYLELSKRANQPQKEHR